MLLKIAVLLCGIACALGATIPDGMMSLTDERIVGGYSADIADFPWQGSLQVDGSHACGASIYNQYHLVTAAHCLEGQVASHLKVRVGSRRWRKCGTLIGVRSFQIHPDYNSTTLVGDVGLIELETALTFSDNIKPIQLPEFPPEHGTQVNVSGWGTIFPAAITIPEYLRAVGIKTISKEKCSSPEYGYGDVFDNGMFCAGGFLKDSCQGDSGGPLTRGSVLFGIVSWGNACALPRFPGVYTCAATYKGWIENTSNALVQFRNKFDKKHGMKTNIKTINAC